MWRCILLAVRVLQENVIVLLYVRVKSSDSDFRGSDFGRLDPSSANRGDDKDIPWWLKLIMYVD